jgi:poly(3-hydroxybutyrate) depolymerase
MTDPLATAWTSATQAWMGAVSTLPWRATTHGLRWLAEVGPQPDQPVVWAHPHELVHAGRRADLLRFPAPGGSRPVLIVPPEINGPQLPDYGPDQSLVRALQAAGFGDVHVLAWRTATEATKGDDVEGSIDAIEQALERLGGAHLIGICQGGWEAAIVAARRPELVVTLTLAAAPIDFRAGDGPLTRLVDSTPDAVYEGCVAFGGGVMRSDLLRTGFTNLRFWERRVLEPVEVLSRLDDERWMARRHRLGTWYHARKDLPGVAYLRIVRELFRENRLVAGTFTLHGQPVRLERITCPVALVAGSEDHITHPEQLFAAERCFGSARMRRWTVPAGHIGVVISGSVLREQWPGIARWLQQEGEGSRPDVSPEAEASAS